MEAASYFQSFLPRYVRNDPELLTAFGLAAEQGSAPTGGILANATDEFVLERIASAKRGLQELRSLDESRTRGDESISKQILGWYLQTIAEGEPYCWHSYPVHSRGGLSDLFLSGISQQFPLLMIQGHPLYTRQDAFDYVSRLHAVTEKFEQVETALLERERRGLPAPALVLRKAIEAMESVVALPERDHPLLVNFRHKASLIKDLSEAERTALAQMVAAAMTESVYPAYGRLVRFCRELLTRAPDSCSLSTRRGGADYYGYLLKKYTTVTTSPEELHNTARREVERISEELRAHLGAAELRGALRSTASTDSEDALLEQAERCIQRASGYLGRLVHKAIAKPVKVSPMIAHLQAFAGQGYYEQPSCLTGGYGVFHLNVSKVRPNSETLQTLTAHETIPGHHLQAVYTYERSPSLPAFRSVLPFDGYCEGWAVYAERLLAELGFYEGDPRGELGRLQSDMQRSVRLLLDTGIHHHGWGAAQAAHTVREMVGDPEWLPEEIERVCIQPAQGAAYKCGELALLDLRERARTARGAEFDLRTFHHEVLEIGPCPLPLLEQVIGGGGGAQ